MVPHTHTHTHTHKNKIVLWGGTLLFKQMTNRVSTFSMNISFQELLSLIIIQGINNPPQKKHLGRMSTIVELIAL